MTVCGPEAPQCLERYQWQGHKPVIHREVVYAGFAGAKIPALAALAAAHMDPHQVAVDIGDGQVQGLNLGGFDDGDRSRNSRSPVAGSGCTDQWYSR